VIADSLNPMLDPLSKVYMGASEHEALEGKREGLVQCQAFCNVQRQVVAHIICSDGVVRRFNHWMTRY